MEEKEEKKRNDQIFTYAHDKPLAHLTLQITTDKLHNFIKKNQETKRIILSVADILAHAICHSISIFPEFNAVYANGQLQHYAEINFGYFINLGQGIKMGVIYKANTLSLLDFSREIKNLALRYIRGQLSEEEIKLSTFAFTNLSSFGVHFMNSPVLEHQSIMFSLGAEFAKIELKNSIPIEVKKIHLTLSFDTRVADCQRALVFLQAVQTYLDNIEQQLSI